jgi:hypothetical protein
VSRRAARALPYLAVVLFAAFLVASVTFAGAAAAPSTPAPATAPVDAVALPTAAPVAQPLCAAEGAAASELILLPPKKRCDTGKACTVPQDCQCMGYPCACVDNKCICAYP